MRSIREGQSILKAILQENGIMPDCSLPNVLLDVVMKKYLMLNEFNTPMDFVACQTLDKQINFIIDNFNLE